MYFCDHNSSIMGWRQEYPKGRARGSEDTLILLRITDSISSGSSAKLLTAMKSAVSLCAKALCSCKSLPYMVGFSCGSCNVASHNLISNIIVKSNAFH